MLITVEDVQARTGETYTGTDLARVNAFIQDVSSLITDFVTTLGGTIPDPTPGSVVAVAVMEVRRYLNTDPGVYTERVDVISDSFAYQGAVVALSPGAEDSLKRWIRSTRKGLRTIRLVNPRRWDEIPPTAPTGLAVTGITASTISLSWSAATDNVRVSGYQVYEGTVLVADVCETTAVIEGLAASTMHTYQVRAYDQLGNQSPLSTPVTGVTSA